MTKYEYHADGDFIVVREGIDPEIAVQITEDWELYRGVYDSSRDPGSPSQVEKKLTTYRSLEPASGAAIASRLLLGDIVDSNQRVQFNRQHPYSFQYFHTDIRPKPIAIVHGSDNGAYDYVAIGADPGEYHDSIGSMDQPWALYNPRPEDVRTIEVQAGDVVIQLPSRLIHRGRNLSDDVRVNMGLY